MRLRRLRTEGSSDLVASLPIGAAESPFPSLPLKALPVRSPACAKERESKEKKEGGRGSPAVRRGRGREKRVCLVRRKQPPSFPSSTILPFFAVMKAALRTEKEEVFVYCAIEMLGGRAHLQPGGEGGCCSVSCGGA